MVLTYVRQSAGAGHARAFPSDTTNLQGEASSQEAT